MALARQSLVRAGLLVALLLGPAGQIDAFDFAPGAPAHISGTGGKGLRLRAQPSLSAPTVLLLQEGDAVTVLGPAVAANRERWYPVRFGADSGWVVADSLAPGPPSPSALAAASGLAPAASRSTTVATVAPLSPPPAPGGARSPAGITATPRLPSLAPAPTPVGGALTAPASSRQLLPNRAAVVVGTDGRGLRLRDAAGTAEPVRGSLLEGDRLTVLAGPVRADGFDWYRVQIGGLVGWAAGNWLAPATSAPAAAGLAAPAPPSPPLADSTSRAAVAGAATTPAAAPAREARRTAMPTVAAVPATPTALPTAARPAGATTPTPRPPGPTPAPTGDVPGAPDDPPPAPSGQTASEPVRQVPMGNDPGTRAARLALTFVGHRYEWGGVQPGGFDCEGLVWYVYRQLGLDLPWGTWNQFGVGQRVGRDELRPGDLVFFRNTYAYGITHVGLAIGGGQFVHALNEDVGVVVSSLDVPYWRAHFSGARRVTP